MKMPPIIPFQIPADGKEVFEIGGFLFDIVPAESHWEIPVFSKELFTHITAKTNDIKRAIKAKLIDEDIEEDEVTVYFDFRAIGIYQNGIPTGSFEIKEDKCEATYAYLRKDGLQYSLDFFGIITFKDNWLGYNGYLKPPYANKPVFPVKIYKRFDATVLDWSHYKFTTYEETLAVADHLVHYLHMENPTFEELPDRLFNFKNLKELVISCKWPMEKLPLRALPEKIGELQQLEQISINGTQFETLPQGLERLKKLNRFYFNKGQLKSVPNGLLQLPGLEHLMLSGHQLESLPSQANLPAIKSLDVSNNKLKTIPAALLQQENLKSINLEKNPLESLPAAINRIKDVKLSIADKKRLMDFEYEGADGQGMLKWDDALFYAHGDVLLQPNITEILIKNNISDPHAKALASLAKKSIAFQLGGAEDYSELGNHRFGGMPDLPAEMSYPKFIEKRDDGEREYLYEFIAQVNCEAIAGLQDYLPRKGMLFFFLQTLHNIYGNPVYSPCKVIYVADTASLKSGSRFEFSTDDYFEMYDPAYQANKAVAVKEVAFPSFYASYINQYLFKGDAEFLKDENYDDGLFEDLTHSGANRQIYSHAINTYGFTQHESPELQASLKLKGDPEDWMILLKVSSAGDFQWGDAGDLFFVIHKSDLVKGDFSNVFVTLESS